MGVIPADTAAYSSVPTERCDRCGHPPHWCKCEDEKRGSKGEVKRKYDAFPLERMEELAKKTLERDPSGLAPHEPGAKLDGGKVMMELLIDFARALRAVGEVATYGAEKYSRGGWQEVPEGERRYTGAMLRHLFRWEDVDESGLDPDAQIAWNALARLELKLRRGKGDV
jgi:hypothetical protein